MSTYTTATELTLQERLRQSKNKQLVSDVQNWAAPNFSLNDHFVTLTYRAYCNPDELERTADIRLFLKKLNRKVYGKAYDKNYVRLKTFPVFELNKSGGLHVHMAIGKPDGISTLSKPIEELAIEVWRSMKCGGVYKGQDVRDATDVIGLIKYCSKNIKVDNRLLMLDVLNIYWPL